MIKLRNIMRAKLLALREGRIALDEEFTSILEDTNIAGSESEGELDDVEDEGEDDEDVEPDRVEGEHIETEQDLESRMDDLVTNLMKQSEEHQSSLIVDLLI
jgi:hypothetical protein